MSFSTHEGFAHNAYGLTRLIRPIVVSLLLAAVVLMTGSANAALTLYASTGGTQADNGGRIYIIDPIAQSVVLVGNTGFSKMGGLDFDNNGVLYGVAGGSIGPATLMTISAGTAVPNVIGIVQSISGIDSLAFDSNNTLYAGGWDGSSGRLLTVNAANAMILTNIQLLGTGNAMATGLDFDAGGQLHGSRGNSSGHTEDLMTINLITGQETPIGGATNVISDIWFAPDGTLFGGSPTGDLFSINPLTGDKTFLFNTGIRISGLTGIPAPGGGVCLDIKPGSCPNPFNPRSQGYVPMALTGSADFDVTQVDISSLTLTRADGEGGSVQPNEGPPGPHTTVDDVATGACGPPEPTGACCLGPNDCVETTESDCAGQGGFFNVDISCDSGICDAPECEGANCANFIPCQDDPSCICVTTPNGGGVCVVGSTACGGLELCPDGNCPPGQVCAIDTCCGDPICVPQEAFCADATAPSDDLPPWTRTIADIGAQAVAAGPCGAAVCGVDPFCCGVAWDSVCVAEALLLAGDLCDVRTGAVAGEREMTAAGPVAGSGAGSAAMTGGSECPCTTEGADGFDDLVMHYATPAMADVLELDQLAGGSEVELCVSGTLNDGTPFEACDCMGIVPAQAE